MLTITAYRKLLEFGMMMSQVATSWKTKQCKMTIQKKTPENLDESQKHQPFQRIKNQFSVLESNILEEVFHLFLLKYNTLS